MADPTSGLDPQALSFIQGPQPTGVLGKVGEFLAHPAVQGALAAYLGAIGSPRRMGLGGAVSRGGLAGLGAFGQAEQLEQKLPLERAQALEAINKIPLEQAQGKLAGARAQLASAQAGQYVPEPQLSQQMAVLSQNTQDPTMSATYALLSEGLKNGSMRTPDAAKILSTAAMSGAKVALAQAQTEVAKQTGALRQEQTNLLPGEVGARIGAENASAARSMAGVGAENAAAALSRGRAGEIPGQEAETAARTDLAKASAERARKGPPGAEHLEVSTSDPTKSDYTRSTTPSPGMTFAHPSAKSAPDLTTEAGKGLSNLDKARKDYAASLPFYDRPFAKESDLANYEKSKGIDPATGMALHPAGMPVPAGWKPGPSEPDGTPTIISADGKKKRLWASPAPSTP